MQRELDLLSYSLAPGRNGHARWGEREKAERGLRTAAGSYKANSKKDLKLCIEPCRASEILHCMRLKFSQPYPHNSGKSINSSRESSVKVRQGEDD